MSKRWLERMVSYMADANTMFGMPPSMIELIVMEDREREQRARAEADAAEIAALEQMFNATPR